jgi:CRP-like cAMP-binding protein
MALPHFVSRLFGRRKPAPVLAYQRADESGFFATQFVDRHEDTRLYVPWSHRAPDLKARPHDAAHGVATLARIWAQDRAMAALGTPALEALASYLDFVELDAGKRIIGQDEQGDFLLVVLQGAVAEERSQPSGAKIRLGESRTGDLLGELSVLDGGTRFCSCTALAPVTLAVLPQPALDRLLADEPRLAAALLAWIAKRLSLRLRQTSARLSVLLTRLPAPATR